MSQLPKSKHRFNGKSLFNGKLIQRETFVSSVVGKYSSTIRLGQRAKSFAKISTGWWLLVIQVKELFGGKKSMRVDQSLKNATLAKNFAWVLGSSMSNIFLLLDVLHLRV